MTHPTGLIQSYGLIDGFGYIYTHTSLHCVWVIVAPDNKRILFEFHELKITARCDEGFSAYIEVRQVSLSIIYFMLTNCRTIYTHYYSSNLIWLTVSRRVDELISSDPMISARPRDVIPSARSSYYCNNVFIICLFCLFFT